MTANEIRKQARGLLGLIAAVNKETYRIEAARAQVQMLGEIAAQLAEANSLKRLELAIDETPEETNPAVEK
jgi:hypothetical protein